MQTLEPNPIDFIPYVYQRVHDKYAPRVPIEYFLEHLEHETDFPAICRKAEELRDIHNKLVCKFNEIL